LIFAAIPFHPSSESASAARLDRGAVKTANPASAHKAYFIAP
jgi:hypothetical protein